MADIYYQTGSTASEVWYEWNTSCTTGSTSGICLPIWNKWNSSISNCVSTNAYFCSQGPFFWVKWNQEGVPSIQPYAVPVSPEEAEKAAKLAAEHRKAWEASEKARAEKLKALQAAKEAAESRAKGLLMELLKTEQKLAFERQKNFDVVAKSGRRYRLNLGWAGNVEEIKEGKKIARFCIHPQIEAIPEHDNLIAQKLLLETDEERFLKKANRTELAGCN